MRYKNLEDKMGIILKDRKLLEKVFVHKSYINENNDEKNEDNERLEFLGDAVLELVVTEYLYLNFKEPEGELTNWRSALVKGENLAKIAKELNLGEYIYLSKGEEKSDGREKNYILANTLEALIGAIYLDGGYASAKMFITKFVIKYLKDILEQNLYIDAKSQFQEFAQDKLGVTPQYILLQEEGPDHSKTFTMGAYIGEELIASGKGSSKQKAELDAAEKALLVKEWKK